MKFIQSSLLGLLLFIICLPAQAIITGELIMVRSDKTFSKAMQVLQESIKSQGYTQSRVHRVDMGLTKSGYPTDKYRVVFFGKAEQIKTLTKTHPELIPYLPLKIAIYAEAEETLLVTSDPAVFIDLYPDPRLRKVFKQWHEDLVSIMKKVQNSR
jgi:uncharacterized protein (DUF302 family)